MAIVKIQVGPVRWNKVIAMGIVAEMCVSAMQTLMTMAELLLKTMEY